MVCGDWCPRLRVQLAVKPRGECWGFEARSLSLPSVRLLSCLPSIVLAEAWPGPVPTMPLYSQAMEFLIQDEAASLSPSPYNHLSWGLDLC